MLLSERRQSEKTALLYDSNYMSSGTGKTMDIVNYGYSRKKNQWLPGVRGKRGLNRQSTGVFKAAKWFCLILDG